ncbi:MAG TPA: cupin [Gemmatimonadaceae bacterium]|nr:cupin [Gemmatimonadaceae bacterium]
MSGRADVTIVHKPWGHEVIWAHTDRYVGKVLHIRAGHALSVQYHDRKDETISLLSGEMIFRVCEGRDARAGDGKHGEMTQVPLRAGDSYRITPGTVHQMEAVTDCQVLEASTPELDDVVRLTDRYGRV